MEALITTLAPAFAIGLALQTLIEWIDGPIIQGLLINRLLPSLVKLIKKQDWGKLSDDEKKQFKSGLVRTLAIVAGVVIALSLNLSVLTGFEQFKGKNLGFFDYLAAGLIISLGTEGINQIIKFVEKAKEHQESQANGSGNSSQPT